VDPVARWCGEDPEGPFPKPPSGRYLVDLKGGPDLATAALDMRAEGWSKAERRRRIVALAARRTEGALAPLAPSLEALRAEGAITAYRPLTVVPQLLVEADRRGVCALARHPAVVAIHPETRSEMPVVAEAPGRGGGAGELSRRSWAVDAVGASVLWQQGLDGTGTVVAIVDTGASEAHRQLRGRQVGWFDPAGGGEAPRAGFRGHGTGVLSTAVGGNGDGVTLGLAPGARWGACAAFPEGRYNNVLLTLCADWIFTTLQPDVVINAWVLPAACDPSLRPIVEAWRAAEILPVFAAGNFGPEAGSGRSPADYLNLFPGDRPALSVGALRRDGTPLERSSRGPHPCPEGAAAGAPYPALLAPGEGLLAALPVGEGLYLEAEGTSFAAGVVAGAAALLIQAAPEAPVEVLEAALMDSAPPGGSVDLPTALGHLRALFTPAVGAAPPPE
jgi:subtilisin family serine protease